MSDLKRQRKSEDELAAIRTMSIGLFVASLIGCVAPLVAIVSLTYIIPKREKLRQAGPLYMVMGYAAIVVSSLFTVALLVFGAIELSNR